MFSGIGYHARDKPYVIDPIFFKHVHLVFGVVLGLYVILSVLTVCGVSETPLSADNSTHKYRYGSENKTVLMSYQANVEQDSRM